MWRAITLGLAGLLVAMGSSAGAEDLLRGFRMIPNGEHVFYFTSDRQECGEPVGATVSDDSKSRATPDWTLTDKDAFGNMEVATGLIRAGDRLYLGGGSYDGTQGAVFVISTHGKAIQRLDLPARPGPLRPIDRDLRRSSNSSIPRQVKTGFLPKLNKC